MLPNGVKAGIATAFFTFITLFGVSLIGYLNDLVGWATKSGATPFPNPEPLRSALFAAGSAALIGLVNAIVRVAQDQLNIGPKTPVYTPPGDLTV